MKLRDVAVTLLTTNQLYDRTVSELARSFVPGEEEFASRIRYGLALYKILYLNPITVVHCRVVSLGDAPAFTPKGIDGLFKSAWEKISAGEAVVCAKKATQIDALSVPEAIIIDVGVSKLHWYFLSLDIP